jgi:hypothetical protein
MEKNKDSDGYWSKSNLIQAGGVLTGLIVFFSIIQVLSPNLSGNDSYFHIKYAWLIWHEGVIWDFPWLQGTLFKNVWVDHQFLYHLLLIPFTWIGDLYLAAKIAGIFWASGAIFTVYELIRRMDKPGSTWSRFAWIWPIVIAASSTTLLYRLNMTRLQAVSLIFMMAAIMLIEKKKYRLLLLLGFFYAWLYHGSVILIPLAFLYCLSSLVIEKRWVWKPIVWTMGGLCLGFIVNPYFPQSLVFLYKHIPQLFGGGTAVPLSSEWIDFQSWFLFQTAQGAWLCLFVGVLILGFSERRISQRTLFWFLANTMMLILFFKARRFVEYWPPFAVVFCASALCDNQLQWMPFFRGQESKDREFFPKQMRQAVFAGLVAVLLFSAGFRAVKTAQQIQFEAPPPERFITAASWLKAHTPKHSIVFNEQWDTFPDLFFHDHYNLWVTGLNPNLTYLLDPRLWRLYKNISYGYVPDTARFLKRDFGAQYALTLKNRGELNKLASDPNNGLTLVWEDKIISIYQIRPSDRLVQMEAELYPYQVSKAEGSLVCQAIEQTQCQDYGEPSAHGFLECRTRSRLAKIFWKVEIPKEGNWTIEGRFLKTKDGGTAEVLLNGKSLGVPINLLDGQTEVGKIQNLGIQSLAAGPLDVEIVYTLPSGQREKVFGMDLLRFTRTDNQ